MANGLGNFEYGVDGKKPPFNGASLVVTELNFSITGAGLDWTDLNQLSSNGTAIFGLDIFSGTNGNTGFVDFTATSRNPTVGGVPGLRPGR
jgi:hypothetical protein